MVAAELASIETTAAGRVLEHSVEHDLISNFTKPFIYKNTLDLSMVFTGSPKGNRTPVNAVRGAVSRDLQ